MNKYKLFSGIFALAGCCYIADIINHICNPGEGILSSALLAAGFFCISVALYRCMKKSKD